MIASSAVLAAQLEIDPQISLAALKIAREHGVCVTLTHSSTSPRTHRHSPVTRACGAGDDGADAGSSKGRPLRGILPIFGYFVYVCELSSSLQQFIFFLGIC